MVQDRPAHFTLHQSCLSRPPITVCLPGKLFKRCPVPAHGPISSCALQEIAAAQLGPVQAAIPGSPAAAAVEAAPSQDNEGPDSALETTLQQHGPVASPLSLQLSGGHPLGSEGTPLCSCMSY